MATSPTPPYNLQCDRNLVGLTDKPTTAKTGHYFATANPTPLLSWSIAAHKERGAYQRAFQVIVRTSFSHDGEGSDVVWDTGIIPGDQQEILYLGKPLVRGEHYFWKVTYWDHRGDSVVSKETGHFMSVNGLDWNSTSWITRPSSIKTPSAYKFAKTVDISGKEVQKAVLYVSGLGFYRAHLNNIDLHSLTNPVMFLTPGWTNYEVRIGYNAFDITTLIKGSTFNISVLIGEGYRNKTSFPAQEHVHPVMDNDERVLRAQLQIDFKDGSESMVINTDKTWEVYTSKLISSSVYNGEIFNATVSDSLAGMAAEVPGPAGSMYLANSPPIVENIKYDIPIQIYRLKGDPTTQIVDFGINFAGVVNISVKDVKPGNYITLKHAEILMHPPYGAEDGSLYFANLRSARQFDMYVSNGMDTHYKPTFTYHGFRYVAVGNYPRDLTKDDMIRIRTYTDIKDNSKFNTSTPLLNMIQDNVVRGQASNLMTIPTDCDQRDERLGWMGDTGLSADSMAMNFHLESYFPHRAMLIRDEQIKGSIPDVTPFYHGGGRPADPSWGAAYPQLVWVLMKQYGDKTTAREYLPSLLEYLDFMETQIPAGQGIGKLAGRYGDWVPPPEFKKIENTFPSAFSLLANIQQVMEMAKLLGNETLTESLSERFEKHAEEFNKAFLDDTGKYVSDLQISYALPLYLDIVPQDSVKAVSARFVNLFSDVNKYHISAGIIGAKYILPALTKLNQNNAAIQCLNLIDYPSWGYMVHSKYEPATTIWELWNADTGGPGMNSRNHHMFSSVSGWMQTDMIGFTQVKGTYGYKEIDLYPASSLDLSSASIQLDHPKPVKYSWHRRGGLQCGKAAEDRSLVNPALPKKDGLVIDCGEGTISKVVFASYGNPIGVCGYHQYGDCHSKQSYEIVESLCLNKSECRVRTDKVFWGDTCPELEVKWLTVAVQCSTVNSHIELLNRYTSLTVDVSIPMHSTGHVNIPAYGLNDLQVWDGNTLAFSRDTLLEGNDNNGIVSATWILERDALKLDLISGDYSFTVKGGAPSETKTLKIDGGSSSYAGLKCSNDSHVISRIDWVSYGSPAMDSEGNPSLGQYHSHASHLIVQDACVGKGECKVPMDKDLFFAGSPNQYMNNGQEWSLVVKFCCNFR